MNDKIWLWFNGKTSKIWTYLSFVGVWFAIGIVFAAGLGILPFIWQIGVAFIGLAALCIAIAVWGDIKGGYADAIDTQWLIRREKRMREIEAKRSGRSKIYEHTP